MNRLFVIIIFCIIGAASAAPDASASVEDFHKFRHAIYENDYAKVLQLIEDRADINSSDHKYSVLCYAIYTMHYDIAKLLIKNNVNVNDPYAVYSCAWYDDCSEILQLLVDKGADVNVRIDTCDSPLYRAVDNGNFLNVRILVDAGAYVNQGCIYRPYLLDIAIIHRQFGIIQYLVKKGAKINRSDEHEFATPLMWAVAYRYSDIVEYLLNEGADVDAKNEKGETALKWAQIINNSDIADFLFHNDADMHKKSRRDKPALQWARILNSREMINMLEKARNKPEWMRHWQPKAAAVGVLLIIGAFCYAIYMAYRKKMDDEKVRKIIKIFLEMTFGLDSILSVLLIIFFIYPGNRNGFPIDNMFIFIILIISAAIGIYLSIMINIKNRIYLYYLTHIFIFLISILCAIFILRGMELMNNNYHIYYFGKIEYSCIFVGLLNIILLSLLFLKTVKNTFKPSFPPPSRAR